MAKVAGSLKEDFKGKLEVVAAMVEEKFMASREECLDGWVRIGGGGFKGGGVVFGISKILLGVILEYIMRESDDEAFVLDGGAD
nr:hypothetical protein [Tanacetum cinerariifolium]